MWDLFHVERTYVLSYISITLFHMLFKLLNISYSFLFIFLSFIMCFKYVKNGSILILLFFPINNCTYLSDQFQFLHLSFFLSFLLYIRWSSYLVHFNVSTPLVSPLSSSRLFYSAQIRLCRQDKTTRVV